MGVASDISRRQSHGKLPIPQALYNRSASLAMFPEPQVQELCSRCISWDWTLPLHFEWLWFSVAVSVCCKKEISLMKGEIFMPYLKILS